MAGTRTTGGDPAEGADPGGTHSTKPGNPDKSGAARPEHVRDGQQVESGDTDAAIPDHSSPVEGPR